MDESCCVNQEKRPGFSCRAGRISALPVPSFTRLQRDVAKHLTWTMAANPWGSMYLSTATSGR